jgi:hypothetical protein
LITAEILHFYFFIFNLPLAPFFSRMHPLVLPCFFEFLEPYNKFSALLAKKICYLRLLSSSAGLGGDASHPQSGWDLAEGDSGRVQRRWEKPGNTY